MAFSVCLKRLLCPQGWTFWQALFYSINVGLGVGYGLFHVSSPGAMLFVVVYCMIGSSFIATAGVFAIQKILDRSASIIESERDHTGRLSTRFSFFFRLHRIWSPSSASSHFLLHLRAAVCTEFTVFPPTASALTSSLLVFAARNTNPDYESKRQLGKWLYFFAKWKGRITLIGVWVIWVIFGIIFSTGVNEQVTGGAEVFPTHVQCPSGDPKLCSSFIYGLMFAITSMSTAAQVSPKADSEMALGVDSLYLFVGIPLYAGVRTALPLA